MLIASSVQNDAFAELCSSLDTLINGQTLIFYTTPIPSTLGDPDTGTLLSSHPLPSPALLTPSGLNVAFDTIAAQVALGTGTVAYARIYDGSSNAICQFTCGTSGAEIIFNNASITSGDTITINSLEINATFS